jgi:cephalosporin hydroxylase
MTQTAQIYINDEHRTIFEQTKHLEGWQEPGDSEKLYELAYNAGAVILEIGIYAGRSAVVELRGALANQNAARKPQFFGVDVDQAAIWRSYQLLENYDLSNHALLYCGDLQGFVSTFKITPTMVFLDGDHRYPGVKRDLQILSQILVPGTYVLCHDYTNSDNDTGELGVRKAVNEFVQEGYVEFMGTFGCSALLLTTHNVQGKRFDSLSDVEFLTRKATLLEKEAIRLNDLLNQERDQRQTHESFILTQHLQAEIEAMKTSKFWKLRTEWFKFKKILGLE